MDQNNGGILGKINTPTTTVASGVWSLDSQFEAQSSSIWPLAFPRTTIANSCRFNSGSTDYLSKTFGTATNTKKFTWSFWVKRTKLGAGQYFFENVGSHTYQGSILFDSSDKLQLFEDNLGSGSGMYLITTQLFRDTSAWYHIVIAVDSTQSTASDRAKIYVNGVQVTSFSTETYPSQNHALPYISGSGDPCNIGKYDNTNANFDGYLTEVIFVDGQQLTPTSFGIFNTVSNVWEPRVYTGTYGNNGIKLNFTDSSNLGDDTSGNGNDFTVNNLTSLDQSTDTCSNNFATMNPLTIVAGASLTLSDGNLALNGNSTDAGAKSTFGVSSGKWYWEIKANKATSASDRLLVATENVRQITSATDPNSQGIWGIQSRSGTGATLNSYTNGTFSNGNSGSTGFNDNTIIGVALDVDNGKIYFHKDGTYTDLSGNTGDPVNGTNPTFTGLPTDGTVLFPYVENRTASGTPSASLNFGSPFYTISSGNADANGFGNFEYAVPSGYFSLCTKNLAEFG